MKINVHMWAIPIDIQWILINLSLLYQPNLYLPQFPSTNIMYKYQ